MNTFKCRFECLRDKEDLIEWFEKSGYTLDVIPDNEYPLSELVFTSCLDYHHMLKLFKRADDDVLDLHVMVQTLQYEHSYTGERNFDL